MNERVMQSYGRCCASAGFFDDFYRRFLASTPSIRAKFESTDMTQQKHLLRHGLLNLVLYSRGLPDTKLRALADSHSRERLCIEHWMYEVWVDCLLDTVAAHDPAFDGTTAAAWRKVLAKGIAVIRDGF